MVRLISQSCAAKMCIRDSHYIWLAGYEKPDFITLNRFRNRVQKEINEVFTQTVLLLSSKDFISLNGEYIDGCLLYTSSDTYPAEEDTPFHQQRDFIDNLSGTLPGNGDDCDLSLIHS